MRHEHKLLSLARAGASALTLVAATLAFSCAPKSKPMAFRPECPGEDSLRVIVPPNKLVKAA